MQLEINSNTLLKLDDKGIAYSVLIEDISLYYANKAVKDLPKARKELKQIKKTSKKKSEDVIKNIHKPHQCEEIDWVVPNNFNLNPNASPNSFGGCLTYSQVLQELDDMRTQYPHLVSQKLDASPTNQTTVEGRTIYYIRISDNPDIDEVDEPETLYQSLIHSREPGSLMQLLFFMWYILENYDSDQSIKNLVNNQELYFIPVLNPDAFVHNEVHHPDGGGMKRKNNHIVGNTCDASLDGIDLNRNAAYYWGNGGASDFPCEETYKGTSPFSEYETQIMRDFFLEHDFKLTLNHHSFKNALLHAYAGTEIPNPRPDEYSKYSHDMAFYNRYAYGPSSSISYLNSGNMNDWMLGGPSGTSSNGTPTGTGSGKNTLAWTPENGTLSEGGFWPLPSNYVLIAKRSVRMNFLAAFFSGKYERLHDLNQSEITSETGNLKFGIENLGQTAGKFTVSVTPVSSNIISIGADNTLEGMNVLDQEDINFNYTLDPNIKINEKIEFKLTPFNDYSSDNEIYETNIIKIYQPPLLFVDNPDDDGLSNWTQSEGEWSLTTDSYSGTAAITSTVSPPYGNIESKTLQLNNAINLKGVKKVIIQYFAKWDLERSFDYVQFEASTDSNSWTPLCSNNTKPGAMDENNTYTKKYSLSGNLFQPDGQALYDGDTQGKWSLEEIIIDSETNTFLFDQETVFLRFNFNTDWTNHQDAYYNAGFEGFTFDNFKIIKGEERLRTGLAESENIDISIYPNPNNGQFTLDLGDLKAENVLIYDLLGKEISNISGIHSKQNLFQLNVVPGLYFIRIQFKDGIKETKLLIR